MRAFQFRKADRRGFKAVELLVVLAVLSIVAGMVIPQISGISGTQGEGEPSSAASADVVKDQSNAQSIVSMWSAVATLGSNLPDTKTGCINSLLAGTNVVFAGSTNHYRISGLSAEDVAGAKRYIGFQGGGNPRLVYHPEGGQ